MNFAKMVPTVGTASPAMRGVKTRIRPVVPMHIVAPLRLPPVDACIDSAADATVFPPRIGATLGINLAAAPQGQARAVGGMVVNVHYAPVSLLLSDGYETCEWTTTVGSPRRRCDGPCSATPAFSNSSTFNCWALVAK